MFDLTRKIVGLPIEARSRRRARAFLNGTARAPEIQRDLLLQRIARHAESDFGRDHDFGEIHTIEEFQKRVPIRGYDGHEPYVARVREGHLNALFGPGSEVLMFAKTSGTTNSPKTIPVTRESLADYRDGWTIWGIQAFDAHPEMLRHGLMPILQLVGDWRETHTSAGVPCGAITGLTAHMQNPLIRVAYCVPRVTSLITDVESKYYAALRLSIMRRLGAAVAANPSTLLGIARLGDREKATLIRDLHDGTIDPKWKISREVRARLKLWSRWPMKRAARRLEAIVERTGRLLPRDYWPHLQFLANWTGGSMGAYLRSYPEYFGDRPVRDIGLVASEGRMTIPIEDHTAAGLLAYTHHFFEFIPEELGDRDQPETVSPWDLVEGRNYFILLTTAGGLYRYHIQDLVRCVGFHSRVPLLEFLNKGSHISSLTGEKLSEHQAVAAVTYAQRHLGIRLTSFLMLPAWDDPPYYSLLVEAGDVATTAQAEQLAAAVETELARVNIEYENKRATLRLGPLRVRRVAPGTWHEFQKRRLAQTGGTVEQYKQPHLMPDLKVLATFPEVDASVQVGSGR